MSITDIFFSFNGRIGRSTFWLYGVLGLGIIGFVVGLIVGVVSQSKGSALAGIASLVGLVLDVVLIWAGLAISVKRWHDRGKSGWWILIGLVPLIGGLWVLIETGFLPGTDGPNQFGPQP